MSTRPRIVLAAAAVLSSLALSRVRAARVEAPPAAVAQPRDAEPTLAEAAARAGEAAAEGHRLWFAGELEPSLKAYERALSIDARSGESLLSGSVVLEELGQAKRAAEWLRRARELSQGDSRVLTALGWAEFRAGELAPATTHFHQALAANPKEVYALYGLGRTLLAQKRPKEALPSFEQAAALAPLVNAGHYWRAQALEAAGDVGGAVDSYKRAIINDSYFVEARYALGRLLMRHNRFNEAALQFSKILDVDPANPRFRSLKAKVAPRVTKQLREPVSQTARRPPREPLRAMLPEPGDIPLLRVGIGTSVSGKPLPRRQLEFHCDTPFAIIDDETNKTLAAGLPRQTWEVRVSADSSPRLEIYNHKGKRVVRTRSRFRIRPDLERGGMTILGDIPYGRGYYWSGVGDKTMRGQVEISLHPEHRRAFRVVNVVDLESYTHGLLSAEMPITSPLEALKAQSVVARSEALYMKMVTRRHKKDGFDICDEQHCQVYSGATAESERSRMVVNATRGRVLAYKGRIAHGIYASNCGGHTQAGHEIAGWGDVGYWPSVPDAPAAASVYPRSPWELRWWLKDWPPAFCMPTSSGHVHASHYRWSRIVPAAELEERINRTEKGAIGKHAALRTLRRAASGHVNGILLKGSRGSVKVRLETKIRHLLGLGSQRSALFTIETEYGKDKRPSTFVFHGAGWGHGVGMCQSGAMGRAEQGQTYVDILKAYHPGTELAYLNY
ncbi:MAG: SpoIID/LytB domain-containing protein [Elusimicrobia bacterium]|nr:SpoIID/LytB domain-containing protein [Elusimicrobiota bacterium]